MSLHFLNENDRPRECPKRWISIFGTESGTHHKTCECHGTGRLGVEGAEPTLEAWFEQDHASLDSRGWYAEDWGPEDSATFGPHETKAAALQAAREGHNAQDSD